MVEEKLGVPVKLMDDVVGEEVEDSSFQRKHHRLTSF